MNKKLIILTILVLSLGNIYAKDKPKKDKYIIIKEKYKLKNKYETKLEVRLLDTKKTTTSLYYVRDFNNKNNTIGIEFIIKLGKNYLEKRLEELEKRLEEDLK